MSAQLQESASNPPSHDPSARSTPAPPPEVTRPPMRNAAAVSKSPYVQLQKGSDVRWQLFSDEAIERAKSENKLIYLHIGFSASHYCYLMMQESFTNRKVVNLLNERFIPIIVDREERPDLDHIYMNYIHSLNSVAGHPINVFLTPELEPVFGGTYFPGPVSQHGTIASTNGEDLADFLFLLEKLQTMWPDQESQIRQDGKKNVSELRKMVDGTLGRSDGGDVDLDQLEEAYAKISKDFDQTYGGFIHIPPNASTDLAGRVDVVQLEEVYNYIKKTPKYLTSAKVSFLLRATCFPRPVVDVVGDQLTGLVSTFALNGCLRPMNAGGIHDQLGGGLHRCSTSRDWSLPSFEKLMSDNALMLGVYLDAWLLLKATKAAEFRDIVFEMADYLTSAPIMLESDGFATSEAADSSDRRGDNNMHHGAYYLWTRKEFDAVIRDEQESAIAAAYWDVQQHGNVDRSQDPHDEYLNQNILRTVKSLKELSLQFSIPEEEALKRIDSARRKLRAFRESERVRPTVDVKVVTAYNGMAINSLSRTAAACISVDGEAERGARYLEAARRAAVFIKSKLWDPTEKTLYRMYYDGGRADTKAFAEDYAFLIEGLLELYGATVDESWLEWADELQSIQIKHFYDTPAIYNHAIHSGARCGAFYSTTQDAPHILLRIKDAMDTAQPSINAVSASNLFRLGSLLDDQNYTSHAVETVNAFEAEILQYPYLYPGLLSCVVWWKLGGQRWISNGSADQENIKQYRLAPRGILWTMLYANPSSGFLRRRSRTLVEKLAGKKEGVYSLDKVGELQQV
ncbi:uncharacterized protein BCR38DRAFT_511115 [Pseudomassariella vexata]|uniref:Spermatogenesis-associated protein 20-like TRX domain-containing protein n=1 Tax=Pseudomassariella vexata TaxID=1141098 RepID=A0A1Y2E887_9PEZI|nr:uncharacterized protein BCR38DRAFT_511115 [Pseudomassariella vexata]ORY67778.1 hypothetical protein BCR38DRAFT_511115 [Pseudomassariella vexata]